MIINELIKTAARSREYLNEDARRATERFIRSQWNRDGGVQGRNNESDLYYTAFAVIAMRAIDGSVPKLRLWNYLRTFGEGEDLDMVYLFSLIRLRSMFPMRKKTREKLIRVVENKPVDSALDVFYKVIMGEFLSREDIPETPLMIQPSINTSELAASVVLNRTPDENARKLIMERWVESGGFYPNTLRRYPTIDATAKALFALHVLGADLTQLRIPCLNFVESLRGEDGGYERSDRSKASDVESTFLALFTMGALMGV